ncbi:hypothetical protein F4212_12805 [Candidatus Poribacteria bacterium]|nr:hypothetical protein [Candidatus Poribacteria bacterium]
MNIKQKLTYMLIGCLFTLSGYVLSNLFNNPTHVQAQDEKVTDEIVCKKLKIVNDDGKQLVSIGSSPDGKNAGMAIMNADGNLLTLIGSEDGGTIGVIEITNADGKRLVGIGSVSDSGVMLIHDHKREGRTFSADGVSSKMSEEDIFEHLKSQIEDTSAVPE